MALKDWDTFKSGRYGITFVHKKRKNAGLDTNIRIIKVYKGWNVLGSSDVGLDQTFKTKPEAMRFAKEYMRTH